ncbi:MAG: nickel pincer cofactor biosynthesis protein LarB [Ignavibacteriales bacterium]|nr:nickel pincer cofactor biosynthesis protein LarB [Ignavibacteriales bacterium]
MTLEDPKSSLDSFGRLDIHRRERTGIPEAVLAEGKTAEQVVKLVESMTMQEGLALVTRASAAVAAAVKSELGESFDVAVNDISRTIVLQRPGRGIHTTGGVIAVLAAGTSDLPVAEEARVTAEAMGCKVLRFYDVGVAGIHRLVNPLEEIRSQDASAVVVVAGMEGALPTVVRGLVPVPVIGVPTSVGYGYGGKGEAALMTMLQSCAPGLTVVNIDNGFGAGATAALIANRIAAEKKKQNRNRQTASDESAARL